MMPPPFRDRLALSLPAAWDGPPSVRLGANAPPVWNDDFVAAGWTVCREGGDALCLLGAADGPVFATSDDPMPAIILWQRLERAALSDRLNELRKAGYRCLVSVWASHAVMLRAAGRRRFPWGTMACDLLDGDIPGLAEPVLCAVTEIPPPDLPFVDADVLAVRDAGAFRSLRVAARVLDAQAAGERERSLDLLFLERYVDMLERAMTTLQARVGRPADRKDGGEGR